MDCDHGRVRHDEYLDPALDQLTVADGVGSVRLDFLAIMAAHLLVGVAMVVAVFLASRRIPPAREPGVLPSLGLGLAIMGMGAVGFVITGHVYYILFMSWFLAAFHIGIAMTTRFRSQEASSSGVI